MPRSTSAEKFANQACLSSREVLPGGKFGPYRSITYKEAFERAAKV